MTMGPMPTIGQCSFKSPLPSLYHLISGDEEGRPKKSSPHPSLKPSPGEDLPYRVEVWDGELKGVEQTLAMTANASIGYAAYYEATREYPDRYVVLRHKNRIVARWNPPGG
jgi:hypothetical protein